MLFLRKNTKTILGFAVLIVLFISMVSVTPSSHTILEDDFKKNTANNFRTATKVPGLKNLAPKEFTYNYESFDLIINNTIITHSLVVESYSNVLLVNSVFNVSGFNNIIVKDYGRIVLDNVTFTAPASESYPSMEVYALNHSTITFLNINASISNMDIVLRDYATMELYSRSIGSASFVFTVTDFSTLKIMHVNFTGGLSINCEDYSRTDLSNVILTSGSGFFRLSGSSSLYVNGLLTLSYTNIDANDNTFLSIEDSQMNATVYINLYDSSHLFARNITRTGTFIISSNSVSTTEIYSCNVSRYNVYWDPNSFVENSFYAGLINDSYVDQLSLNSPRIMHIKYSRVNNLNTVYLIYGNGSIVNNEIIIGENGIGPYPYVNVSSTVNDLLITNTYNLVNIFSGGIYNSTISSSVNFYNCTHATIYNSSIILSEARNSILTINSSNLDKFSKAYFSMINLYNTTIESVSTTVIHGSTLNISTVKHFTLKLSAFNNSKIVLSNSTISNVDIYAQETSCQLYNLSIEDSGYLALTVNSSTKTEIKNIKPTPSAVSHSTRFSIYESNITLDKIYVDASIELYEAVGTVNNTRLYGDGYLYVFNNSYINASNLDIGTTLYVGRTSHLKLEKSNVSTLIYSVWVNGGYLNITNNELGSDSNNYYTNYEAFSCRINNTYINSVDAVNSNVNITNSQIIFISAASSIINVTDSRIIQLSTSLTTVYLVNVTFSNVMYYFNIYRVVILSEGGDLHINDTVIDLLMGNPAYMQLTETQLFMYNSTVNGEIKYVKSINFEILNTNITEFGPYSTNSQYQSIDGIMNQTRITSEAFFFGQGTVRVNNSYFYVLQAILTNVILNNTSVTNLLQVYYTNVNASIINNVPSGFNGTYVNYDSSSTITNTYLGVVAFNGYIDIRNTRLHVLAALNNSIIDCANIDTLPSYNLNIMLFNNTKLILNDANFTNLLVTINVTDSAQLEVNNVINITELILMHNGKATLYNTNINNIYMSGNISLTVENVTIPRLNISASILSLTGTNLTVQFGLYIKTTRLHLHINGLTTEALVVMVGDVESTINVTFDRNPSYFNVLGGNTILYSRSSIQIGEFFFANGTLTTIGLNIGNMYATNSTIWVNNSFIEMVNSMRVGVHVYNSSIQMLGLFNSTGFVEKSNISYIGCVNTVNLTVINSTLKQLLYIKPVYRLPLAELFYVTANDPNKFNLEVYNSTVTELIYKSYNINGAGKVLINGETISTKGLLSTVNSTGKYVNTVYRGMESNAYKLDGIIKGSVNYKSVLSNVTIAALEISLQRDNTPPTISVNPSSLHYEFGMKESITVFANDDAILKYIVVKLNEVQIYQYEIYNKPFGVNLPISNYISEPGTYTLNATVTDLNDNTAIVTATITVEPSEAPQIEQNINLQIFELGMVPDNITWRITESYPNYFIVRVNGSEIMQGNYTNGQLIIFNTNKEITSSGTYIVNITVYDQAGNKASKEATIKALPGKPPQILTSPNETITITQGETIQLNWTATDDYPGTYEIKVNGTVVASGNWDNNQIISYNFYGEEPGTYVVEISFMDLAGHATTSTVTIKVTPQTTGGLGIGSVELTFGISLAAVAIVLLILIRTKKLKVRKK